MKEGKNQKCKLVITGLFCCLLLGTAFSGAVLTGGKDFKHLKPSTQQIIIPESNIVLYLWEETINQQRVPYYSIIVDNEVVRTTETTYDLGLRYAQFDPRQDQPLVDSRLSAGEDTHLFIVQFYTQPLEIYHKQIEDIGGQIYHYIAQHAYLIEMTNQVIQQVNQLPYVRWIGPYHPAYRLEEYMLEHINEADRYYPLQRYNIQVHTPEMKQTVADRIIALGGTMNNADAGKVLVEATLTPQQLLAVIRWDEVLFVDRWSALEPDMNNAREIGGANYIETVAGFKGEGVRGEVFDAGFNLNHVDFLSRPLIAHGTVGSDSHGASTSGIIFGDGTGNAIARGMLPKGQGIVADYHYTGLTGSSRYTATGQLVQVPYYAVFQTASVGSSQTTQYTTYSADTDTRAFDFDIVLCQSQSNLGDQRSRPEAWAKNIISVGGVYHYDTLTKTDDCWCGGASIGPASDGRIKPDLTHFYDYIYTTTCCGTNSYTASFSGTSGATPIVAGHAGLVFEMWAKGIFGNPVDPMPPATIFDNRCHMTTTKALLINTADQYPFTGLYHDKTRMHQGWGMPSVKNLYDLRNKIYVIDEDDVLVPFEKAYHHLKVLPGESALRITMTYADRAGNPAVQTQHRINDLTLKVTSPSGSTYYGNYGLKEGVWSTVGGSPDTKDTVECVFVPTPESGYWTIQVSADELIQDTHVETPELDADYALVVTGVKQYKVGDVNWDGTVNFGDINPFVAALQGEAYFYQKYPDGNWWATDCNYDGQVNFGDINPFVWILTH